jgi:hypothetical protein
MTPGAMAATRIPWRASSSAQVRVAASSPAFEAAYADCPAFPERASDERFTITPVRHAPFQHLRRRLAGHQELPGEVDVEHPAPLRGGEPAHPPVLLGHESPSRSTAALFTSTLRPPSRSEASRTNPFTAASSATSPTRSSSRPGSSAWQASRRSPSPSVSTAATRPPARASSSANRYRSPLAAPVTSARTSPSRIRPPDRRVPPAAPARGGSWEP